MISLRKIFNLQFSLHNRDFVRKKDLVDLVTDINTEIASINSDIANIDSVVNNGIKTYKALLTSNPLSSTTGVLQVGVEYFIAELQAGDDFSNVGYVEDYAFFTATGTTPTVWTNNTEVYNLNTPIEVDIQSPTGDLDDIVWEFVDPFQITGKKVGAFPEDKTFYLFNNTVSGRDVTFAREDDDTMRFDFKNYSSISISTSLIKLPILIEVKP